MHTYVACATARMDKQGTTAHISMPQLRTLACATFYGGIGHPQKWKLMNAFLS